MKPKLAMYLARHSVENVVSNGSLAERFVELLKDMGFEKVYIENYRDGKTLDFKIIESAVRVFEKDFEVSGGVAIGTWGEGLGENADWWHIAACISDERNQEVFAKAVELQALIFNEVLIDDFWANWCYSQRDVNAFNAMFGFKLSREELVKKLLSDPVVESLWAKYSADLLTRVSQAIVDRARDANRNVKVILKVAEWREMFYHRGLKLDAMARVFDGIYIGTESREGTYRYGSLFIVDFVRGLVGEKLYGTWFDSYNGYEIPAPISPNVFVEQLWFSLLSGVKEVTFFQGLDFVREDRREHVEKAKDTLKQFQQLYDYIKPSKRGVVSLAIQTPFAKPFDNYIEDVLGSLGVPVTSKPLESIAKGDLAILDEGSVTVVSLAKVLEKGADVLLTGAAIRRAVERCLGEVLELVHIDKCDGAYSIAHAIAFAGRGGGTVSRSHRRPYAYPVPVFEFGDGEPLLHAVDEKGRRHPVLVLFKYGESRVYAAPITMYLHNLYKDYPEVARQALRDIAFEYVGVKVEPVSASSATELSNISLVLYDDAVALANMNSFDNVINLVINRDVFKAARPSPVNGNLSVVRVEENSEVTRARVVIKRNSIDFIKF